MKSHFLGFVQVTCHFFNLNDLFPSQPEEHIDLEELEQFAKIFKRRRIELGMPI